MRISDWSSDVCSSDLVACDAPGPWLAVAAPIATWRRHLQMPGQGRPEIFPRACACPRDARRLLVRLARVTRGGMATGCDPARLVEAICAAVVEQQHDLSALVSRCSGRNLQRRQQTMLRLLRVRLLIERSEGERT